MATCEICGMEKEKWHTQKYHNHSQTEEIRNKISEALKGDKNPNFGKHPSEESRRKMKESHMGKLFSEETKQKLSESHSGEKSYLFGKKRLPFSQDWKKNLSESHMGIPQTEEQKRKRRDALRGKVFSEEHKKNMKISRAKQITPIKDTSIEIKIQTFLRQWGIDFFTHQYMKIEHGYQCDIFIPDLNLVIECDGNYWHKYPVGKEIDHIRTQELIQKGFKVLRFWESDINKMNLFQFIEKIKYLEGNLNE